VIIFSCLVPVYPGWVIEIPKRWLRTEYDEQPSAAMFTVSVATSDKADLKGCQFALQGLRRRIFSGGA
jgi:hypothetical protein